MNVANFTSHLHTLATLSTIFINHLSYVCMSRILWKLVNLLHRCISRLRNEDFRILRNCVKSVGFSNIKSENNPTGGRGFRRPWAFVRAKVLIDPKLVPSSYRSPVQQVLMRRCTASGDTLAYSTRRSY